MKDYLTEQELRRLSFKKIKGLQDRRFQATVRYMLPETKFYNRLFKERKIDPYDLESVHDWQKKGLPLVKKSIFRKRPKDFLVQPRGNKKDIFKKYISFINHQHKRKAAKTAFSALTNRKKLQKEITDFFHPKMPAFSGGSEDVPVPVLITARQKLTNMQEIVKIICSFVLRHVKGNTVGLNLFPYAPHLGWHTVHMCFDHGTNLNLCTAGGGVLPTSKLVELAGKSNANIIAGMSDYIRNRFLDEAIKKRIRLPETVVFINGAGKILEKERNTIKEKAGKLGVKKATILDVFGASEFKEGLMPECSSYSGFHNIAPLTNIIKTIKMDPEENSKDLVEGWRFTKNKGYATVWNINGAGTLLEGFLIGDMLEGTVEKRCPSCGLNVQRIKSIDRIRNVEAQLAVMGIAEGKVKGATINLSALRDMIINLNGIDEAQVILKKLDEGDSLIIRPVFSSKDKRLKDKIKRLCKDNFEVTPKVEPKSMEDLMSPRQLKFHGILIEDG
jgi:phenylacetate-coenzyme A ligase PaaK-like adenylate-forming protein